MTNLGPSGVSKDPLVPFLIALMIPQPFTHHLRHGFHSESGDVKGYQRFLVLGGPSDSESSPSLVDD